MKRTLVLGASLNPSRYSNIAMKRLKEKGHEIFPLGIDKGHIDGIPILHGQPQLKDIHTVTLYLSPKHQKHYYEYILGLSPKRIIFNPGTENPIFIKMAKEKDIEVEVACTLVMLSIGNY